MRSQGASNPESDLLGAAQLDFYRLAGQPGFMAQGDFGPGNEKWIMSGAEHGHDVQRKAHRIGAHDKTSVVAGAPDGGALPLPYLAPEWLLCAETFGQESPAAGQADNVHDKDPKADETENETSNKEERMLIDPGGHGLAAEIVFPSFFVFQTGSGLR